MATKTKPVAGDAQEMMKPVMLGRSLNEIIASMSPESQARINTRSAELYAEIERLKAS